MSYGVSNDPYESGKDEVRPAPGQYHVSVDTVKVDDQSVKMGFKVITGTAPGQTGAIIHESFFLHEYQSDEPNKKSNERIGKLLWAGGLLKPGESYDGAVEALEGTQMVLEVYHRPDRNDKAKVWPNISWRNGGCWPLGDPNISSVPVSQEHAAHRKQAVPQGGEKSPLAGL